MNVRLSEKDKIQVTNPEDIYLIMQRILLRENRIDREKEHFWIVGMNQAGVILYIELISMGSVKSTSVEPMNVFRVAILKGATRVIAVHNHPSGNLQHSEADKDITDRLIQVGKIINIAVVDHLIISPVNYTAFSEIGLMRKLEESTTYVPTFLLIEKIKKEQESIKEQAIKKERELRKKELLEYKKNIVRNLLKKGISTEQIAHILDIPLKEVEKLIR